MGPSIQLVLWENLAMQCNYMEANTRRASQSPSPNRPNASFNEQYAVLAVPPYDYQHQYQFQQGQPYPLAPEGPSSTSPTALTNLSNQGRGAPLSAGAATTLFNNNTTVSNNAGGSTSRSPSVPLSGHSSGALKSASQQDSSFLGQSNYIQQTGSYPPLLVPPSRAPSSGSTTIPNFANVHNTARSASSGLPSYGRSTSATPSIMLGSTPLPPMPASTASSSPSTTLNAAANGQNSRPASRSALPNGATGPSSSGAAGSNSIYHQNTAGIQQDSRASPLGDALSQTSTLIDTLLSPMQPDYTASSAMSGPPSITSTPWITKASSISAGEGSSEKPRSLALLPSVKRSPSTSISISSTATLPMQRSASSPHSVQSLYQKSDTYITRPPSGPVLSTIHIPPLRSHDVSNNLGIASLDYQYSSYQPSSHYIPHAASSYTQSRPLPIKSTQIRSPTKKVSLNNLFNHHNDNDGNDVGEGLRGWQEEEYDKLKLPPTAAYRRMSKSAAGNGIAASLPYGSFAQNLLATHTGYPQYAPARAPAQAQQQQWSPHAVSFPPSATLSRMAPQQALNGSSASASAIKGGHAPMPNLSINTHLAASISPSKTTLVAAQSPIPIPHPPSSQAKSTLSTSAATSFSATQIPSQQSVSQLSVPNEASFASDTTTAAIHVAHNAPTGTPRQLPLADQSNPPNTKGKATAPSVLALPPPPSVPPTEAGRTIHAPEDGEEPATKAASPPKKAPAKGGRGKAKAAGTGTAAGRGKGRGRGKAAAKIAETAESLEEAVEQTTDRKTAGDPPPSFPPSHIRSLDAAFASLNRAATQPQLTSLSKPPSPVRRSSPKKRFYAEDGISDPEGDYKGATSSSFAGAGPAYAARNTRGKKRRVSDERGKATAMKLELGLRSGSRLTDPAMVDQPNDFGEEDKAITPKKAIRKNIKKQNVQDKGEASDSDLSPLPSDYQDTSMDQIDMSLDDVQADTSITYNAVEQLPSGLVAAYAESEADGEEVLQPMQEVISLEESQVQAGEDKDEDGDDDEEEDHYDASFDSQLYP